jgi:hypothetical protein
MGGPNCPYYSLACRPLLGHYNGALWKDPTTFTISLSGGLYIASILDRYGGPLTSLTIALSAGLYLAITMDPYGRPQTALTIALPAGLYLAIIMDRYGWP